MITKDRNTPLHAAGILATCAIFMMTALALCSCNSQRDLHKESLTTTQSVDTSLINSNVENSSNKWWWLSIQLDSIIIRMRADSVVTPKGAIVYNPAVDATITGGAMEASSVEKEKQTESVSSESTTEFLGSSSDITDDESETDYSPPWMQWLSVIVAFIVLYFLHRKILN